MQKYLLKRVNFKELFQKKFFIHISSEDKFLYHEQQRQVFDVFMSELKSQADLDNKHEESVQLIKKKTVVSNQESKHSQSHDQSHTPEEILCIEMNKNISSRWDSIVDLNMKI